MRTIQALVSVATLILAFWIGTLMAGRWTGLLAVAIPIYLVARMPEPRWRSRTSSDLIHEIPT